MPSLRAHETNPSAIRWRYDQRLVEAAVFRQSRLLTQRCQEERDYREALERVYKVEAENSREQAFFNFYWHWFCNLGLKSYLDEIVACFPIMAATLSDGIVALATTQRQEKAELFKRESGATTLLLRIQADRFQDRPALRTVCSHELFYVEDILDPAFGYSKAALEALGHTLEAKLVRERYHLLWAIQVDARLKRADIVPVASEEQRFAAFKQAFPFLSLAAATACFHRLWTLPRVAHDQMLSLAIRSDMLSRAKRSGGSCPLCGFSSHAWMDPDALDAGVISCIQADFPLWKTADGLCDRCAEVYRLSSQESCRVR